VIEEALAEAEEVKAAAAAPAPTAPQHRSAAPPDASKFLVGVTSCPTGIAHTFMAAEAIRKRPRTWI